MYDRMVAEANKEGLNFNLDTIKKTPNTVLSHLLINLGEKENKQNEIKEKIYQSYFIEGLGADGRRLPGFQRRFRDGWDVAAVRAVMARFAGVEPQPARFQGAYKSSWFLRRAEPGRVAEISDALAAVSLRVRVIYSSGRDLDILPAEAGKGSALVWLCEQLGFSAHEVVVAGDTENDLTMFQVPGVRAIAVANALPGLLSRLDGCQVHLAGAPDADGVIEGLMRFGLNPAGGRSSV